MPRYKITIEYDGTPFCGWQRQSNGSAVQEVIEQAIYSFCGKPVTVYAAGRTDAGVHALGQVGHIDLQSQYEAETIRDALNFYLKQQPISILLVEEIHSAFHARFSAISRHYCYKIINRSVRPAIGRQLAWHVSGPLNVESMHNAAQELVGKHDFTTFRASKCQSNSPIKTLDHLEVSRQGEQIQIRALARSFLHHQVRSMVGTLKMVGEGKWTSRDVAHALMSADRRRAGPTAPAHGLYLVCVKYEP